MNANPLLPSRLGNIIFTVVLLSICLQIEFRVFAAPPARPALSKFKIPPPQKGVTDLKFSEFFVNPIGPAGLDYTSKLQSLNSKRVRILGHMVHQENRPPGTFLLSAIPVHDDHYGLADDLPASTLLVIDPSNRWKIVRHVPGLVLVSGTLELGRREEPDGRISLVRLVLDSRPHPRRSRPSGKGSTDLLRSSSRF